jgi:hypothetical protein
MATSTQVNKIISDNVFCRVNLSCFQRQTIHLEELKMMDRSVSHLIFGDIGEKILSGE